MNEEAKNERISPNALVNRILQDYCLFYRHFKRFPCITLTQKSFSKLVGGCPKEDLKTWATEAGSATAQDIFFTLGLGFNNENVRYFIKEIYGNYGNWFIYNHHNGRNTEVFHLRHTMGINWSLYVSEVISTIFEKGLDKKVKAEFSANAVTLEVPLDKQT